MGTGLMITWQNGPLALASPGPGLCGCGAKASWAYDRSSAAAIDIATPADELAEGAVVELYCGHHGPNTPPRREPSGAFVTGVIQAALDRLEHYQSSKFRCRENALAITKLEEALHWLEHRTRARVARGVDGTHEV